MSKVEPPDLKLIAGESTDELARRVRQLALEGSANGYMVEAGWQAYRAVRRLDRLPEKAQTAVRKVFWDSAHFLFAALDTLQHSDLSDDEVMRRIDLLQAELENDSKPTKN